MPRIVWDQVAEQDLRIFSCGATSNPRRYVVLYLPMHDGIQVVRVIEGHRDYPALFR